MVNGEEAERERIEDVTVTKDKRGQEAEEGRAAKEKEKSGAGIRGEGWVKSKRAWQGQVEEAKRGEKIGEPRRGELKSGD
jgi:hypothetical protein